MAAIWDVGVDQSSSTALTGEAQQAAESGLELYRDRVIMSAFRSRLTTSPGDDAYTDERWVNDIHLESASAADDDRWRAELIRQGVALALKLLPLANDLDGNYPSQAIISLQSSPGSMDADVDFPVGNFHLSLVREEGDDARTGIDQSMQPVCVITSSQTST